MELLQVFSQLFLNYNSPPEACPDEQMGAATMDFYEKRNISIYIYNIYLLCRLRFAALDHRRQPLPPPAFPVCAPATL